MSPLRIAIVGAGFAGITAFLALSKLETELEITLFDAAKELREVGASIAIQPCGLRVLEELGVGEGVEALAYRGPRPESMVYRSHMSGEILSSPASLPQPAASMKPNHRLARFFRPHLQSYLISKIPQECMKLGMRLKQVSVLDEDENDVHGRAMCEFEDGTIWRGDLVVGADGIRSQVRQSLLPEYKLDMGRACTIRGVFPIDKLFDAGKGETLDPILEDSCHWWGERSAFFTTPLKGDLMTVVAFLPISVLSSEAPPPSSLSSTDQSIGIKPPTQWNAPFPHGALASYYPPAHWHNAVAKVAALSEEVRIFPDWHGPHLQRMDLERGKGRVIVIGDGGHPHGGAYAAGGGLAMEDAYTLYLSLAAALTHTTTPPTSPFPLGLIPRALHLTSACRSPHTSRLLEHANAFRAAREKREDEGVLMSDEQIKAAVGRLGDMSWLGLNDTRGAFEETVKREGW